MGHAQKVPVKRQAPVGRLLVALALGIVCSRAEASRLTDIVNAMPFNSWQKINVNEFSEAWPSPDRQPDFVSPASTISAWSSAAWDASRESLYLYGTDKSSDANPVYVFDTRDGLWKRGSLPSAVTSTDGVEHVVGGYETAPIGGETWDNLAYLKNLDRLAVMNLTARGTPSNSFMKPTPQGPEHTGPYLWDPAKADPNKVGGVTGSQVGLPDVEGGNMWENRDSYTSQILQSGIPLNTAYAEINGKDTVFTLNALNRLYKATFDPADAANDTWELVGVPDLLNSLPLAFGTAAFDPTRSLYLKTLDQGFVYWDVSQGGPSNSGQIVVPDVLSGTFEEVPLMGLDYDPVRDLFVSWKGDDEIWLIDPPDILGPNGWTVTQVTPSGVAPVQPPGGPGSPFETVFTGVYGKWAYMPGVDAFIGVIDPVSGDTFVYRPTDAMPSVAMPEPASGLALVVGLLLLLVWNSRTGQAPLMARTLADDPGTP